MYYHALLFGGLTLAAAIIGIKGVDTYIQRTGK